MNKKELLLLQKLPHNIKLAKTKLRIEEAVYRFGVDGVYTSYSGGMDSEVLRHIVQSMYGDKIPSVFNDTGLEDRRLRDHAKSRADIVIVPVVRRRVNGKWTWITINHQEVITKYDYPVVTKAQAMAIRKLTTSNLSDKYRNKLLYGDEKGTMGKLSEKWKYLLTEADFLISEKCCDIQKKSAFHKFDGETGRIPLLGTLAEESIQRERMYIENGGCNAFTLKNPQSNPLGFWTKQDTMQYVDEFKLTLSAPYGEVIKKEGKYCTTCASRTGCQYCAFGAHLEKGLNRFQRMSVEDPVLLDYVLRGGKHNEKGLWIPSQGLGYARVLDLLKIPYIIPGDPNKKIIINL